MEARQFGKNVLSEAIGEVLLFRIAAHVHEWQDRNGWFVGKYQRNIGDRCGEITRLAVAGLGADNAGEAITFAGQRADQPLMRAAVAKCVTDRIDPGRHRPIGDDAALPDRLDQAVIADHTLAVCDQEFQNVEHLRLDGNNFAAATQLAPVTIKTEVLKPVDQGRHPLGLGLR